MARRARYLVLLLAALDGRARAQSPASSPGPRPAAAASVAPAGVASPAERAGATTDERLRRVRERKAAIERDVARLRGQEQSLLAEVERLDLEVRLRSEQLRETQLVLHRSSEQMDAVVRRVHDLEASVAQARPQLAARARALYKMGDLSYLRMLLSVERPADLLRGFRFVSALARRDREKMAALRQDLATLATTRADLERKTRETLALRADLDHARRALEADRQRKSELLTSIVEKKETHAAYLQELEEAEGKLSQLLSGLSTADVTVPITVFKGSLPWPAPGKVRITFGRHKHPRFDTYTLYAHLAEARVQPGQHVAAGTVVGTVGASAVDGAGLYFEVRSQGKPQDPLEWLAREGGRAEGARGER